MEADLQTATDSRLMLVGNPNVGKSVLFNRLTGRYVIVSNYPGTTVEISRGYTLIGSRRWEVVDTPGIYSLAPITEEERVTRNLLLDEHADLILYVMDAKNMERMLPLCLQLLEGRLPLAVVLNMMDEAEHHGIHIDHLRLQQLLEVPVIPATLTQGRGVTEIRKVIARYAR